MNSPRRLGRGLEALLGQPFGTAEGVENVEGQPAPHIGRDSHRRNEWSDLHQCL